MVHTTLHTATLSHRGTKIGILVSKELTSIACRPDVTACFTSASNENLVSHVLPKNETRWKSMGPVRGTVVRKIPKLPALCCDPSSAMVAARKPHICNWPRREAVRHLLTTATVHRLLLCQDTGNPWCHAGTIHKCQFWVHGQVITCVVQTCKSLSVILLCRISCRRSASSECDLQTLQQCPDISATVTARLLAVTMILSSPVVIQLTVPCFVTLNAVLCS